MSAQIQEGHTSSRAGCAPPEPAGALRTRLFQSPLGLVENVGLRGTRPTRTVESVSSDFQVCLPYRGLFVWHVGGEDVVGDANQVLFVSTAQAYRFTAPLTEGYAELIITPAEQLLVELLGGAVTQLASHALFRLRSRRADPEVQLLRTRFLHRTGSGNWDLLAAEELVLAILRHALDGDSLAASPSPATSRLIRRTKEFVETHLSRSFRLGDVASSVGASPAYLTDVFRRFEGLPLHRYAQQSRLARALIELPHADDLTSLALELGFSSHSHFAAVFRRTFACTPSEFRASTRRRREQLIA
jgi:AraC-like DNA-binding protein